MGGSITGVSSIATRSILDELGTVYQERTGCQVAIRAMGGIDAARLVRAGETTDVVVLASGVIEKLEAEGHLVSGSRVDLARSKVAVAVPAGCPWPGVADEEAVKQAVLQARRICISTGPSGDQFRAICERWGMSDRIAPRLVQAPPGIPVGSFLARGDADLGFQQLSELLGLPGIEVVGTLPARMNMVTVFSGAIARSSARHEAAAALLAFLASPNSREAKIRHGMEPL